MYANIYISNAVATSAAATCLFFAFFFLNPIECKWRRIPYNKLHTNENKNCDVVAFQNFADLRVCQRVRNASQSVFSQLLPLNPLILLSCFLVWPNCAEMLLLSSISSRECVPRVASFNYTEFIRNTLSRDKWAVRESWIVSNFKRGVIIAIFEYQWTSNRVFLARFFLAGTPQKYTDASCTEQSRQMSGNVRTTFSALSHRQYLFRDLFLARANIVVLHIYL